VWDARHAHAQTRRLVKFTKMTKQSWKAVRHALAVPEVGHAFRSLTVAYPIASQQCIQRQQRVSLLHRWHRWLVMLFFRSHICLQCYQLLQTFLFSAFYFGWYLLCYGNMFSDLMWKQIYLFSGAIIFFLASRIVLKDGSGCLPSPSRNLCNKMRRSPTMLCAKWRRKLPYVFTDFVRITDWQNSKIFQTTYNFLKNLFDHWSAQCWLQLKPNCILI